MSANNSRCVSCRFGERKEQKRSEFNSDETKLLRESLCEYFSNDDATILRNFPSVS